ncbi:hypothetical protein R83H12_01132 [Fibrobacteria bacterium R8-3-H12]
MKRAFTLTELLVYIMLLGFVIVVAGRVFSESAVMRLRSQNMIRNSEEVGKVSNLIKEDISQMGVKGLGHEANNPKVYWNAQTTGGDSSSYALFHRQTNGAFYDSIVFRKAAFDDEGHFLGIREIALSARENTSQLVRRCATVQKVCPPAPDICGFADIDSVVCPSAINVDDAKVVPIVMADSIVNFNIIPGTGISANPQEDTLFGLSTNPKFKLLPRPATSDIREAVSTNAGTETTVTDFAQNSTKNEKLHNELYLAEFTETVCKQMAFKKSETYAIEFKMPFSIPSNNSTDLQQVLNSTQFVPGRDHLAIGLRNNAGDVITGAPSDVLFYPPQSGDAAELSRLLELSVGEDINACVAITIAYYPTSISGFNAANGILKFSNFKVFRKTDETFHFSNIEDYGTTVIKEKINAKAFELILEIKNRGEKARNRILITTPNNGVIPQN